MTGRVLLYGATGFSGRLLADRLHEMGLDLVLAGRDGTKLAPLASDLDLPYRVFGLGPDEPIDDALADIAIVLHAAGPFQYTGAPMMAACIRTRTTYLDLAGEWPVFADAMELDGAAAAAGIMLMPGVGFNIVASDCLLALAAERVPDATLLRLAIAQSDIASRGTLRSALSMISPTVLVRRGGALREVPVGQLARDFDFGAGPQRAMAMSWPDVVTGQFTTGVPDIEAYSGADWSRRLAYQIGAAAAPWTTPPVARSMLARLTDAWPEAPSAGAREGTRCVLVVEAVDPWRRSTMLRLRAQDGYSVTTSVASEIVRRILGGAGMSGFCTPGRLFGGDFILGLGCAALDGAAS